jgi:hypothetical protein
VAAVDVSPTTAASNVGQVVQLVATPKSATGAALTGRVITWSSSAEAVAAVSPAGAVLGVSPGQASITATVEGQTGTAILTVTPVQPASCTSCLEIVPSALMLATTGAEQQLVAFEVDAAGNRSFITATFESSNPAVVAVTTAGRATATADLGSTQLTARAGSLVSAPVLALVAQPAAGALLVSDAQIDGSITPVDPTAPYAAGWQYRVRLSGVSPTVGQIVLSTGTSPVGGRVVSVAPAGSGKTDVVLELLPIDEMFAAISINQQISLAQAPSEVPAGINDAFAVEKLPNGMLRYRLRQGYATSGVTSLRNIAPAVNEIKFELGRFSCEAKVEGALSFPLLLDAFSFDLDPNLFFDVVLTASTIEKLVVHGDIAPTLSSNLHLNAAVKGEVQCKVELRKIILPIGGPIALVIGGQIPLGVGFALEAKAELAGVGYDAFFQSNVSVAFGLDCAGSCRVVGDLTNDALGFFKPILPSSFNDLRTELAASVFGYAEMQLGNPFVNELQFKAVEIKAGLQQKAELASEKGQADDASYASNFRLAPMIEAKSASSVSVLAELLKVQFAVLSFEPELPTLAESPRGTFAITPAVVEAGTATNLGDKATFTVTLDPVNFVGAYAVEGVEIRWQKPDGAGSMVLLPGRPGCTSLTPAATGQMVFTCETDFLEADAGTQTFFAFVKARLFGISVPVLLEVAANGSASVQVNVAPPLVIGEEPFSSGTVGMAYSDLLHATGGSAAYEWSIVAGSLPAGLSLNGMTGMVDGTPMTAGSFNFTVQVRSGEQTDDASFTIVIQAAPPPPPPPDCPDVRIETNDDVAANNAETCMQNVIIGGFNNNLTIEVLLPSLTLITEAFAVRNEVPGGLSLPALAKLGSGGLFEADKLAVLNLPALTESRTNAGNGIIIQSALDLTTVSLGAILIIEGDLIIELNPKLTNISGIRCGAHITGDLVIRDNPLLPTAAANALASCLIVDGNTDISGNKP